MGTPNVDVVMGSQTNIKAVNQDDTMITVNADISTLSYQKAEPIELEVEGSRGTDGYNLEVAPGAQVEEPLTGEKKTKKCCADKISHTVLSVICWIVAAALLFSATAVGIVGVYLLNNDTKWFIVIRIMLYLLCFFFMGAFVSAIVFTWKCCTA